MIFIPPPPRVAFRRCLVASLAVCGMALVVSCGDDSSDKSPVQVAEESSSSELEESSSSIQNVKPDSSEAIRSSSSICEDCDESSSSVTPQSSSSETSVSSSSAKSSSSSAKVEESSSSAKVDESSSSMKAAESSSSEKPVESSSSEKVAESSSSEVSSSTVVQPCKTKTEDNCIYGTLYDERDGKTYKTVKIGSQEWMAENLNYSDSAKTPSLKGKSWCYDNKETECSETGLLYLWTAVIDSIALATNDKNPQNCGGIYACSLPEPMQGICPVGWHIPEVSEWRRLFAAIGGVENAGKLLKSQTSWYENGNGLDSFGFSVFSVGYRSPTGSLGDRRFYTFFWTYRIEDNGMARSIRLKYDEDFVKEIETQKYGFSVRCVKNAD